MKKCPFCAEEIQEAAIKCRYCSSFLSAAPPQHEATVVTPSPPPDDESAPAARLAPSVAQPRKSEPTSPARRILYQGSPSWRAFFREYTLLVLAALIIPFLTNWIAKGVDAAWFGRTLAILIPLALAAVSLAILHYYRRSKVVRVTASNIEVEHGFFARKIDVLELWRCRDIQYRQSFFDRILRIAHVDIFTTDVTTPTVCIVGLPASRELFENIRDSIEIQRQSRNVLGMVQ